MALNELRASFDTVVHPFIEKHKDCFYGRDSFLDFLVEGTAVTSRAFEADPTYFGPLMVPMADMVNLSSCVHAQTFSS